MDDNIGYTQEDKVEPVIQGLTDSMTFYKAITKKLSKDKYCFLQKRQLEDDEPFDIVQVIDSKLQRGMVAFVSVSTKVNEDE